MQELTQKMVGGIEIVDNTDNCHVIHVKEHMVPRPKRAPYC